MSLFDTTPVNPERPMADDPKRPLAERMRPQKLEDFIGQEHILGPGKPLRSQIDRDEMTSVILWGPPGVGKTTLYRWMHLPGFRAAYRQARRELVEGAIGRMQAAVGQAVETLVEIARDGRRDGDRIRAATAVLDHALRGLSLLIVPSTQFDVVSLSIFSILRHLRSSGLSSGLKFFPPD